MWIPILYVIPVNFCACSNQIHLIDHFHSNLHLHFHSRPCSHFTPWLPFIVVLFINLHFPSYTTFPFSLCIPISNFPPFIQPQPFVDEVGFTGQSYLTFKDVRLQGLIDIQEYRPSMFVDSYALLFRTDRPQGGVLFHAEVSRLFAK